MSLMSSAHSAWLTADLRVAEAVRAQARGRLAEATELLADALKIDNQNSQALHLLGAGLPVRSEMPFDLSATKSLLPIRAL